MKDTPHTRPEIVNETGEGAEEAPFKITMQDASEAPVLRPREFKKSLVTRTRILDSAVQCLAEVGYHRMSSGMIAERASIARSVMQYHFPNRTDLLRGLIRHVHYEMIHAFVAQSEAMAVASSDSNVDIYWKLVQGPLFMAYSELHFASRTDEALRELITPVFEEYERDRIRVSRQINLKSHWVDDPSGFDLGRDVSRFLIEGMALSAIVYHREERINAILDFIKGVRRSTTRQDKSAAEGGND